MSSFHALLGLLLLAPGLVACGASAATIPAGTMPEGGTFRGVWSSPEFGDMQLCDTNGRVVGQYVGDRRGLIQGNVEGDLLLFEWREDHGSVMGRAVTQSGHGYLRIAIDAGGHFTLEGERGLGEARQGQSAWHAVPVEGRQPTGCYDALRM